MKNVYTGLVILALLAGSQPLGSRGEPGYLFGSATAAQAAQDPLSMDDPARGDATPQGHVFRIPSEDRPETQGDAVSMADAAVYAVAPEIPMPAPREEADIFARVAPDPYLEMEDGVLIRSSLPYLQAVKDRLDQAMAAERMVGMAVAVIENGEPVLVYTGGETAAGTGEPVTTRTLFRAASVSKTFAGTLLAHLEAEGRLDLDEIAEDVTVKSTQRPTLIELVSHRTGLPNNAYDNRIEEANLSVAEIRGMLAGVDLICPVGGCYSYQNVAFSGLERAVERATGLDYRDAVRSFLFNRYGLHRAGFGEEDLTRADSWARPHRGWSRTTSTPGNPASTYDVMPSAASVVLSLEDMIAWAQAFLREGEGVPHELRERIFTPHTATPRETNSLQRRYPGRVSETHYGMGWRIYQWGDRTLVAHSGYLGGFGANIVLEPERGFGFVALWNADTSAPWRLWPTVMDLRTGDGPGDWLDDL
jgi:beta-lactamase class C